MNTYESIRQQLTSRIGSVDDATLADMILTIDRGGPQPPNTPPYVVHTEAVLEYDRRASRRARALDDATLTQEIRTTIRTDQSTLTTVTRHEHAALMEELFRRHPAAEQAHDAHLEAVTDWDSPDHDTWAHVKAALQAVDHQGGDTP